MFEKNKSPLHPFPGSKSRDAFSYVLGGYHWVKKCWNRIARCPERLRT